MKMELHGGYADGKVITVSDLRHPVYIFADGRVHTYIYTDGNYQHARVSKIVNELDIIRKGKSTELANLIATLKPKTRKKFQTLLGKVGIVEAGIQCNVDIQGLDQ